MCLHAQMMAHRLEKKSQLDGILRRPEPKGSSRFSSVLRLVWLVSTNTGSGRGAAFVRRCSQNCSSPRTGMGTLAGVSPGVAWPFS